jgi:hypothetical protein
MSVVATNPFSSQKISALAGANHAATVSLSDTDDLATVARCLLISADATVKVTTIGGESLAVPLQKGYNNIWVTRVWSTGTTLNGATLIALW